MRVLWFGIRNDFGFERSRSRMWNPIPSGWSKRLLVYNQNFLFSMKTFGCFSAFSFLFFGSCLAQNNPRVAWGSSVYEYVPFPQAELSWSKARDAAAARGGWLATITSQDEHNAISTIIQDGPAWLGGYRPINGSQWFWITG